MAVRVWASPYLPSLESNKSLKELSNGQKLNQLWGVFEAIIYLHKPRVISQKLWFSGLRPLDFWFSRLEGEELRICIFHISQGWAASSQWDHSTQAEDSTNASLHMTKWFPSKPSISKKLSKEGVLHRCHGTLLSEKKKCHLWPHGWIWEHYETQTTVW